MTRPGDALPVGAVVLSGGLSHRMGRHKALLRTGDHTFLEAIVSAYRKAGIDLILVATHRGVTSDPAFPHMEGLDLMVLEKATAGPLQTLWHALDRIEGKWTAFFFHPVDHPFVSPETLEAMRRVYEREKPMIVQPRCGERGGHPVLIDLNLAGEVRAASAQEGLRQVVRADPERVRRLSVEDEGVLKGVNLPSDL